MIVVSNELYPTSANGIVSFVDVIVDPRRPAGSNDDAVSCTLGSHIRFAVPLPHPFELE